MSANVSVSSTSTTASPATRPGAIVTVGSDQFGVSEPVSFVPPAVVIHIGQSVEWQWQDHGLGQNVTFADGTHSATKTSGTYARTFTDPGRFAYASTVHFDMSGVVVVQP